MHLRSHPKFAQMGWTRISRIRWKSDGVSMRADDGRLLTAPSLTHRGGRHVKGAAMVTRRHRTVWTNVAGGLL